MSLEVEVISDIACPWCYVGKHNLDKALAKFGQPVKVTYRPYMIDLRTKQTGEEYLAYNRRRWGGDGWTKALRQRGKGVGCEFKQWKVWPHTLLAHRLLEYVHDTLGWEAQVKMKEAIFRGCYELGMNVSLITDLAKIASEACGLDIEKTTQILKSKAYEAEVLTRDQKVKKEGISGVPYFIFKSPSAKKIPLSGSQPAERMLQALKSLSK